jgi:hypothetical protein
MCYSTTVVTNTVNYNGILLILGDSYSSTQPVTSHVAETVRYFEVHIQ